MILTLLDNGSEYLNRVIADRQRLVVSYVAFGSGSGYTLPSSALGFINAPLGTLPIDLQTSDADSVTFTVILPKEISITFGEVAILTSTGIYLAAAVLSTPIQKTVGSEMQVLLTVNSAAFSQQVSLVTDKVSLLSTRVDYDDYVIQLQAAAVQTQTLGSLVANETGETLIELMAGVAEHNSYMIESAVQEAFPDSAKLDSSQYAIQVMLRNRLTRKTPAGAVFSINRTGDTSSTFTVPAYSIWTANGGTSLFNRDAFQFGVGQSTLQMRLYEGQVNLASVQGLGTDYQFWTSTLDQFQISDIDVRVSIGNTSIPVVQDPLWNFYGKPAVQDSTDKFGKLLLSFGNLNLGSRPSATDVVNIMYVVTQGAAGNNDQFVGGTAVCSALSLTAVALTNLSGGGDQPSITLYQRMGGDLFGAQRGAVTPSQYRATARRYPGVLDAVVLAQRDLAPLDKNWFNIGKAILLTDKSWSEADREAFETWFRARTQYSMRYVVQTGQTDTDEPKRRVVNVVAKLSCRNDSDLVALRNKAENAVRNLFAPRAGILSRNLYRTDITDAIMSVAPELIDFIELVEPASDVYVDLSFPDAIATPVAGGSLSVGSYRYQVASVDADGVSAPANLLVDVVTGNSGVTLSWDAVPLATGYIVYGRSGDLNRMIALPQGSGTISWTDTGSGIPSPNTPPSSISTSGVHYVVQGTSNITAAYSRRSSVEERGYVS